MSKTPRIATDGSASNLGQNPFAALSAAGLPQHATPAPVAAPTAARAAETSKKNRGRV